MNTPLKSEKGQALILIALAMIVLIAFTALAVDGGNVYAERRRAQNAADTAVLDAALAKIRGGNLYNEGLARAATNGYDNDGVINNVYVYNPPSVSDCNSGDTPGPYVGNTEYVQVVIKAKVKTFFAPIVGVPQVQNCVEAIARTTPSTPTTLFFGSAIVGLNPDACKAVKYQGNADTLVTGGGIYVNSDCPTAAFFNNSAAAQLTAPCLEAVGGIQYKEGSIIIPIACIITGSPPLQQPAYPDPSCTGNAVKTGNTLSPGNYSGTFPPNGVTNLESGIYCVQGNFRLNGGDTLIGHDVLISVETGDVRWNGGATIQLDAPDSGPYKGLLLFLPESNTNEVVINGNSSSTFTGTILAPSSAISIEGTGSANGFDCQIIGDTVDISGTSDMTINFTAANNYMAPIPPTIELTH